MNTPEHFLQNNDVSENSSQGQNQFRQIQGRDYGRILRESNRPARWYKASPTARSIYFYDPHYQRYLQQQSKFFTNIRSTPSPTPVINPSTSRNKCNGCLHHVSNNHQQKPILSSRLQSVPKLPPIVTNRKPIDK